MAESTGQEDGGKDASHIPCSVPFPSPYWGWALYSETPPRQEFGLGPQKAEERGSGHPGLDVLTSARLRAEQAQDWLLEGHSPAQLIAYAQGWLGHFRHDHWEERRRRLNIWACKEKMAGWVW